MDSSTARGYGYEWQKYRAGYLRAHPLCVMCMADGRVTSATVVDHITPHRGNEHLFWDEANHQALCGPCHNGRKAREEAQAGLR
jgi:5-methylcytosine-specific restriction endonuclease McrA